MSYSNWGAFVYRNNERRKDKEDVGVFDTDEASLPSGARIFANILKNMEKQNDDKSVCSHHAVLGDGEVRICAYKIYPELWRFRDGKAEEIDMEQFLVGVGLYDGEIDGYKFRSSQNEDDNMIYLYLTEPDGAEWHGECGYCYGAGFEEE